MRSACLVACLAIALGAAAAQPGASTAEVAQARSLLDSWKGDPAPLTRASAILDKVLEAQPANVEAMKERARLTIMSGYLREVTRDYRGHIYTVGSYLPGTLENAEAILLEALRIKPDFAEGYVLLGHVYVEREKPQEAAQALRKAESLGTDDPWLHLNWASLHESRAEIAASRERWQRVIRQGTANEKARGMAYGFLIVHLRKEGRHEEAIALYREQLARSSNDAWGHGGFASYLQSLGRYEEAIEQARTALRIMDYGIGRRTLAVCLYSRWGELLMAGRRDEAQPYFDEAYGIYPDLDGVMVLVGQTGRAEALIRALVKEKKVSIDARDRDGSTPLLIAVNTNNPEAVKLLLSLGADPNAVDRKGWTPLISAADEGNEENVKLLLAAGADRKASRKGMTADVHAQVKGYPKLAQLIRDYVGAK